MISPFLRYVEARIAEDREEYAYKAYMTDGIQLAPQSKYIVARWCDLIAQKTIDNRSGDEIAMDIITRAGLSLKGGEEE